MKVVTVMCGWGFSGMSAMWLSSSLSFVVLLVVLAIGAYWLGKRSHHRD